MKFILIKFIIILKYSYLAENLPVKYRGRGCCLVGTNYILGELLVIICFSIVTKYYKG